MTSLSKTRILGTGRAFPRRSVSNSELESTVDTTDQWIYERTGIRRRHISDIQAGETNSALAAQAARIALQDAGIDASQIDRILVATVSPDHIMPSTACMVQELLGAKNAAAFDLAAACSGFVYGLEIGNSLIQTGTAKYVLLIGSEVLSSFVNWKDRSTCILFGDGAGAVVLGPAENTSSEILATHLQADGSSKDLFFVPAGGSSIPLTQKVLDENQQYMQMKGKEIFKVAVRMLADCSYKALDRCKVSAHEIAWVVPHQANARIIESLAKRMEIPLDKIIFNIEEYGNTSSATVPTAFDQAIRAGKIKRGDLVLFTVFGAGLTYGAAVVRY